MPRKSLDDLSMIMRDSNTIKHNIIKQYAAWSWLPKPRGWAPTVKKTSWSWWKCACMQSLPFQHVITDSAARSSKPSSSSRNVFDDDEGQQEGEENPPRHVDHLELRFCCAAAQFQEGILGLMTMTSSPWVVLYKQHDMIAKQGAGNDDECWQACGNSRASSVLQVTL